MAFSLGPLPRPTSADDLASRVRGLLVAALPDTAEGLDSLRVDARVSGGDVEELSVDLTGVSIDATGVRSASRGHRPVPEVAPDPGTEVSQALDLLHVVAHPVTVMGAGVDLDLAFHDLTLTWSRAGGDCLVDLVEPSEEHPARGRAVVSVSVDDLAVAVHEAMSAAVGDLARVEHVDLSATAPRPNTLHLEAAAQARKGMLSAVVIAQATVSVDHRMVATVSGIAVNSPNPLFAAALRLVHSRLSRLEGRRIALNTVAPGLRASDLRVTGGRTVTVAADFA